jgi:adenosine deaminase
VTRIAHGIAAASDPALLARLRDERVLLEVCPTSNLMTGAVRTMKRHPLPRLLDAGVRVAIATDDRTIFGTTLRKELAVARALGLDRERSKRSLLDALQGSFAPKPLRASLARRIAASFDA